VKKFSKGHHSSLNELNITPLLDLAFVLLVIFIITTPQLSNDLEMNLPSPKKNTAAPAAPPKINRIQVDAAGLITLNEQVIQPAALKPTLVAMKTADPGMSVVVRGAADVDYQRVVVVLDALQQADITKVGLATETAP
jgi:biopolymer transport protein ExbD